MSRDRRATCIIIPAHLKLCPTRTPNLLAPISRSPNDGDSDSDGDVDQDDNDSASADDVQRPLANESPAISRENPYLGMFSYFRDELDEHHDRRERVIKTSRDITALSKKMIFTLQRVRKPLAPLPSSLDKEYQTRHAQIQRLFSAIAPDLQGLSANRYARQISGGIQEYIEALSFHHYLVGGTLIPLSSIQESVRGLVEISPADYILGIFDLVGEIMRFGITTIAMRGDVKKMLCDLRELRMQFEGLDTLAGNGLLGREVGKKMDVMKTCVEKVETAVCGLIVRGSERPKGWVPEFPMERTTGGTGGGRREGGGFGDDRDE